MPGVDALALHDGHMYLVTVKDGFVADPHADGTVSD